MSDYDVMMSGGAVLPETGRPADVDQVTDARHLVRRTDGPERARDSQTKEGAERDAYALALERTRALKSQSGASSSWAQRALELARKPGPLGVPWGVIVAGAVVAAVVVARRR